MIGLPAGVDWSALVADYFTLGAGVIGLISLYLVALLVVSVMRVSK